MSGNDLTIEKVVATVRERGPMRNLELRAVLGADDERAFDRLLQKARKAGLLRCSGGRWAAADRETSDEKIARLERELTEERQKSRGLDWKRHEQMAATVARYEERLAAAEPNEVTKMRSELEVTKRERDEANAELEATVAAGMADHARIEGEMARLAREVEQLRVDLVRVTEERNSARESRRAMEFELKLLRDGRPSGGATPAAGVTP